MHIYNPNNIFQKNNTTQEETTESFSSGKEVCAKKTHRSDGSIKYQIKLDRSSKLYNPFSSLDNDKTNKDIFINDVCRQDHKFKEVNQKAFDWYIQFLDTKNISWLNNAEREIM